MSPVEIALHALALPFGVALAAIAVLRVLLRLGRIEGGDRAVVALGIGAGYLAGHAAVAWPSAFPPIEVTDRIPFVALLAIALGVLDSAWPTPWWARWENRLLMTAVVLGAVLGPLFEGLSGTREGLTRLGGIGLAMLISWASLDALAVRLPPSALGLSLGIATAGAGVALLLAGNAVLCQLMLALGASLGAAWLLSLWRPSLTLARGGIAVLIATFASLMIYGQFYSSVAESRAMPFGLTAVALGVAPLFAWVGRIGPIRRRPTWVVCLAVAGATLVPVAVAVALALRSAPEPVSY